MTTFRRRDLRRPPLGISERQLLRTLHGRSPLTPAECVELSGVRPGRAWPALAALTQRGLAVVAEGSVRITAAGRSVASREAQRPEDRRSA
jgi:hypothetical protein